MRRKAILLLMGLLLLAVPKTDVCAATEEIGSDPIETDPIEDEEAQTGWVSEQDGWKYYNADGVPATGWLRDNGVWYYLEPQSGRMFCEGWKKIDNKWYWFKPWGGAAENQWQKIKGQWYYFDRWAIMKSSAWVKQGKAYYYLKSSGEMAVGKNKIDGIYYRFRTDGAYFDHPLVAVDAGHQRKENTEKEPIGPGASEKKQKVAAGTKGAATGKWEYELNLEVSQYLCDALLEKGYPVYMIRETHDVNISNAERALLASEKKADILVRIHANGSDDRRTAGVLTMAPSLKNRYVAGIAKNSQLLSKEVVDAFCAKTGARNRGVQQSDSMSGINWSKIPVTIVEMGYMTNAQEDRKMAQPDYQKKMADGIAAGVDSYFRK